MMAKVTNPKRSSGPVVKLKDNDALLVFLLTEEYGKGMVDAEGIVATTPGTASFDPERGEVGGEAQRAHAQWILRLLESIEKYEHTTN
jgi:hypothetical protein